MPYSKAQQQIQFIYNKNTLIIQLPSSYKILITLFNFCIKFFRSDANPR